MATFTQLHSGNSTFTINPAIKKSMPFDTIKDFTPVAFIARSLLVTASNKLPVKSTKELLTLAASKPGQITYASFGEFLSNEGAEAETRSEEHTSELQSRLHL